MNVLLFNLDSLIFGVPIEEIREVGKVGRIKKIPGAPGYVEGFTKHRGEGFVVINLPKLLKFIGRGEHLLFPLYSKGICFLIGDVVGLKEVKFLPRPDVLPLKYIKGFGEYEGETPIIIDLGEIIKGRRLPNLKRQVKK